MSYFKQLRDAQAAVHIPPMRRMSRRATLKALFQLATGHRRIWGARGVWGRQDPFRKYDGENP